ncbi:MAG: hypothetical protein OK454_10635, partial [Thaumarchaeota archaeon]|nr:hypothetical protein [Nitrososphaerota archaeon]
MTSNIFSRLVPTGRGRSFYDELRARDHSPDPEERAALALDEENLNEQFHDYDLENAGDFGGGSRMTVESNHNRPNDATRPSAPGPREAGARWLGQDDEGDNDVPASLLVEPNEAEPPIKTSPRRARPPPPQQQQQQQQKKKNTPIPGPATRRDRAQWETTQDRQRLHQDHRFGVTPGQQPRPRALMANFIPGTAREKAMWRWVNVSNLDN